MAYMNSSENLMNSSAVPENKLWVKLRENTIYAEWARKLNKVHAEKTREIK